LHFIHAVFQGISDYVLNTARILLIFAAILPAAVYADVLTGKVIEVQEGDLVKVLDATQAEHVVRIAGIDAPDLQQSYGQAARRHLSVMLTGMPVSVQLRERDKEGVVVGKVLQGSTDIGLVQLREGMAWHATKHQDQQSADDRRLYADAEAQARKERVGLWRERKPKAPWDFVKGKRKS
jgi:endonuclease YncB( thermonuclease family)